MSKRGWIIFSIILFCLVVIVTIGLVSWFEKAESPNESTQIAQEQYITDECTEEGEIYGEPEEDLMASSAEEKVSPNANLVIKKYYKQCGHTTKEYAEIPAEMVNKTQEQIEKLYPDMSLEGFSPQEVVILKQEEGICDEHYILREKEGNIAIYMVDKNGKETLREQTGISTEYLPQTDLETIQKGIKVYGKEKLNSLIEDYE